MKNLLFQILCLICFSIFVEVLKGQSIWINEIMADNETTVVDAYGEFSDWIEIYNYGQEPVSLSSYYLSDDKDLLLRWRLPDVVLEPDGYFIVFCSGKDFNINDEWHTNFKISGDGEKLFLSTDNERIIDDLPKVELDNDVSYGKFGSGNSILSKPTPGKINVLYTNTLSFSHENGCYASDFELYVSASMNHKIHYTIDGQRPSVSTLEYLDHIVITSSEGLPLKYSLIPSTPQGVDISYTNWSAPSENRPQVRVLRFQTFHQGYPTSPVYTKLFYIGHTFTEDFSFPVLHLTVDSSDLFAYESGIYVPGQYFNVENPEWTGNYFQSGWPWEKQVHLSYFENDMEVWQQKAGVRIKGQRTRLAPQKSFRIIARQKYGNSTFEYPLIDESDKAWFKSFVLRTTMGSWGPKSMVKDEVIQRICKTLDVESMDTEPVITFLNGEYWGLYHLRDNMDEHHLAQVSGLESSEIEMFNWVNGHYFDVIRYMEANDLREDEHYQEVSQYIDISNFIDYQIAEIFFQNIDWPGNNDMFWRPRKEDGKWRWILFDLDAGMLASKADFDMYDKATNDDVSTKTPIVFKSLLKNETFRDRFVNRYLELLENQFATNAMLLEMERFISGHSYHIDHHYQRWNFPGTVEEWEEFVDESLVEFFHRRPCDARSELFNYFELDSTILCREPMPSQIETFIKLYPNPAQTELSLELNFQPESLSQNSRIEYFLSDMQGRIVSGTNQQITEPKLINPIDIKDLPSGLYSISIILEDGLMSKRFVKIE